MKPTVIEKKLRRKLTAEGVNLEAGGRAERGVIFVADVGAKIATTGERALRKTRSVLSRAAEGARDAIHRATKPPARRKKK